LLNDGLNKIKSDVQATQIVIGDLKNGIKFFDFKIDGLEKSLNDKIDGLEKGLSSVKNTRFWVDYHLRGGSSSLYSRTVVIGH
jgi:phage-related protein